MAFGSLFAYIFAEGWVDSARVKDAGGNHYVNNWGTHLEDDDDSESDNK